MAVGDAHRNAGAAGLPHDQTAEFVHMAVDDAVLQVGGENLIERMGIGEGTLCVMKGIRWMTPPRARISASYTPGKELRKSNGPAWCPYDGTGS